METVIELEKRGLCRVMSEKKGRFTVENLNHVRCALVSDSQNLGLLEKVTTSAHYDQTSKTMAAMLTLNMRETQKKKHEANYLMDVVETYTDDYDCIRFADSSSSPHVIIFALSTDEKSHALEQIDFVKKKIESQEWDCPLILLAYRSKNSGSLPYDVMKQLKELSRNSKVFRCMESTGLGRNLIRHCFAVALMAARPFLAKTRAEHDVCIDDGMEKRQEKSRRENVEQKDSGTENVRNKSPFRRSCKIQ